MWMTFPQLWEVGVHTYQAGSSDGYGGTTDTWTPPKNQPGTPCKAIVIAPVSTAEPKVVGHDRVTVEVQVLAYKEALPVGPYDLIDLPSGAQYEVIGEPEDYTLGLDENFGGVVVNLRKVSG